MDLARQRLLELLRCSLWGAQPSDTLFCGAIEWSAILNLSQRQAVLCQIYTQLEQLVSRPERPTMLRLHGLTVQNRATQSKQLRVLEQITRRLREGGIERPVLLKGLGVGANYLDAGARQCGDIDLYVGPDLYQRACFLAKSWPESITEYNSMSRKHYHFTFEGVIIELHRIAISDKNIPRHSGKFVDWCCACLEGEDLRSEVIEGVEVYLPPYDFDALYIFQHAWDHFCTSGIAFRQICDWARYLTVQYENIDHQALARRLQYFGLVTPWSLFGAVAVNSLGLNPKYLTSFDESKLAHSATIESRIWEGGNFGFYSGKYAGTNTNLIKREVTNFIAIFRSFNFLRKVDRGYAYGFLRKTLVYTLKTKVVRLYYTITKKQ